MVAWFVYGCPIFYHIISAIASALQLLKTLWASELQINNSHKGRVKMKVSSWDYFIVTTTSKRSNLFLFFRIAQLNYMIVVAIARSSLALL
jgi:hypothetical protein